MVEIRICASGRIAARQYVRLAATMPFRMPTLPVVLLLALTAHAAAQETSLPHLEKRGLATQLIVDGKPFLMLGGELHNSSSSSLDYMKPEWLRLSAMSLNTVLTPLSWELVEPVEGKFDFTLLDGLLTQAREQHMRIVFLWFGSWKNGMSSYPPVWVKRDTKRFPRVMRNGEQVEILTPLNDATRDADARAFVAVMQHLREVDGRDHTVLMMQVENEVGILGDTRDHSREANRVFASAVPEELMQYLQTHKDSLDPEFRALWEEHGEKSSGTWAQVFGDTSRADEIFMAWFYARYVNAVAAKGKAAYKIPMYANTWLSGQDATPGDYPSGGPEPRVLDIWKAAGSSLDFYSPDLYAPEFVAWSNRYHRAGNPLFIPETNGGAAGAANVYYAIGEHAALGFSPFGIDSPVEREATSDQSPASSNRVPKIPDLGTSYDVLAQLWPLLQDQQTKGNAHGFILDSNHPSVEFNMNGYVVRVSLDELFGSHAEKGYGVIMATGPEEFLGAGTGFRVLFSTRSPGSSQVGLAAVDEGKFQDGKWIPGRRLNGDENDQGNYWRFDPWQVKIEKALLYKFE
jgi:beta-galactosidase GanA